MLNCGSKYTLAMTSGAAVTFMGFDRLLPAPAWVHSMLAGAGVDYYCRGMAMDMEKLATGSLAVTGSLLYATLMR